jgi:hypothetical protein
MHIQELINWYQAKTDEELVQLAADLSQLTPEAKSALANELARRRLDVCTRPDEQSDVSDSAPVQRISATRSPNSYQTHEFLAEVLRVYHSQLVFFLKLIAPAVIGSYITVWYSRYLTREMAERLFQTDGSSFTAMYPELWALAFTRYFISWSLFFFAFGAICTAISQIDCGETPSVRGSFAGLWKSKKPFLQLCIVLFLFALVAYGIVGALVGVLVWGSGELHIHLSHWVLLIAPFIFGSFLYLVLSRLALAVPAVLLDRSRVWPAIFRSDELTEGEWPGLMALLTKSLIGGYIAGNFPYWFGPWVASHVPTFSWFPSMQAALSLIAVMLVEPPMFIGFALLYVRMSEEPADSSTVSLATTIASA